MKRIATFSTRLAQLRQERNWTLETVSKMTGHPAQTINRWERAERVPKIDVAASLAEKLNVSVLWLFGYDVPQLENVETPHFSKNEIDMIEKYRQLDQRGKAAVDNTLEHEYQAMLGETSKADTVPQKGA